MTPSNIYKKLQDNLPIKPAILKGLQEIIKEVTQKPISLEIDSGFGSLPSTPRFYKKGNETLSP